MAFDAPLPMPPKFTDDLKPYAPTFNYKAVPVLGCDCTECRRHRVPLMAMPDKFRDLAYLKNARARIARGWCQGTTQNGNSVCSVGALLLAVQAAGYVSSMTARDEAEVNRLAAYLPDIGEAGDLIRFNDTKGRQKEEVLRLFDLGIARLEGEDLPQPHYIPRTRIPVWSL